MKSIYNIKVLDLIASIVDEILTHPNKVMVFVHVYNLGLPKYYIGSKRIYLKSVKNIRFFCEGLIKSGPLHKKNIEL